MFAYVCKLHVYKMVRMLRRWVSLLLVFVLSLLLLVKLRRGVADTSLGSFSAPHGDSEEDFRRLSFDLARHAESNSEREGLLADGEDNTSEERWNQMANDSAERKVSTEHHEGLVANEVRLVERVVNEINIQLGKGMSREPFKISPEDHGSLFYKIDIEKEDLVALKGSTLTPLGNFRSSCWLSEVVKDPPVYSYVRNPYFSPILCNGGGSGQDRCTSDFLQNSKRMGDKTYPKSDLLKYVPNGTVVRMRCLPHVYVIGVTKAGTTDLFSRLLIHPDIVKPSMKEPMWFNRNRIGFKAMKLPATFSNYLDIFDKAAYEIWNSTDTAGFHQKVTLDGTPAYFWDYDGWQAIPGNQKLSEPKFTVAHALRAVNPDAKIILTLRNPVDRLYSHFIMRFGHLIRNSSTNHRAIYPSAFDHKVQIGLKTFARCLERNTLRGCVYDKTAFNEFRDHIILRASLYSVLLQDWLDVFPRDQIKVIRSEDYSADPKSILQEIFKFLGLEKLDEELVGPVSKQPRRNYRTYKDMWPETRRLLNRVFRPFNRQLATMLNDASFLWDDRDS